MLFGLQVTERSVYILDRFRHSPVSSTVILVFYHLFMPLVFVYIDSLIFKLLIRKLTITCAITEPAFCSYLWVLHLVIYFRVSDNRISNTPPY